MMRLTLVAIKFANATIGLLNRIGPATAGPSCIQLVVRPSNGSGTRVENQTKPIFGDRSLQRPQIPCLYPAPSMST